MQLTRFASRNHFASWNGTALIDASSGDQQRHRLYRAGNRRINGALHIMAIAQLRHDTEAAPITGASSPRARRRWKLILPPDIVPGHSRVAEVAPFTPEAAR